MADLRLTTLGRFELRAGDAAVPELSTSKARAIVAYLVERRGSDVSRERLVDVFWPDAEPERARDSLNTALWSIRRSLRRAAIEPASVLMTTKLIVRWIAPTEVDREQFLASAASDTVDDQRHAMTLFAGEFLEGDYQDWAVAQREDLSAVYEQLLSRMLRFGGSSEIAQKLLARNPYDEDAYATLIEAALEAERPMAAAALADRARAALAEIGSVPSDAFRARFADLESPKPSRAELRLPFAGRAAEIAQIEQRLADRVACTVLVHGPAGIGKTTLLARIVEGLGEGVRRVVGIPCGEGAGHAFGPWPALFERFCAGTFEEFAPEAGPADIARAIVDAFDGRVAFVIDDAHELRGEALSVFSALVHLAERRGHAVMIATRPEGVTPINAALLDVPLARIGLGALEQSDYETAFLRATGSAQPQLVGALYRRTEGHPLFFSTLLTALVERGDLRVEHSSWQLVGDAAADGALPPTLRHVIEARLSSRGPDAATVACALALESEARADDLTEATGFDETRTLDALDDLFALGVVEEPRRGPSFAFTHDLMREVAATIVHPGRRAKMHAVFARRLAEEPRPDAALRRARHLLAAGQAFDAAHAYGEAAWEALGWGATDAAIERATEGAAAIDHLPQSTQRDALLANLYRVIAGARLNSEDLDGAIESGTEAVEAARNAGDPVLVIRCLLVRNAALGSAFRPAEMSIGAREALERARALGDPNLLAKALIFACGAMRHEGRLDDATALGTESVALAADCEQWGVAAAAAAELLACSILRNDVEGGLQVASEGLIHAMRADRSAEATFRLQRAGLSYFAARFGDARAELEIARRLVGDAAGRQIMLSRSGLATRKVLFLADYFDALVAAGDDRLPDAMLGLDRIGSYPELLRDAGSDAMRRLLAADILLDVGEADESEKARVLVAGLISPVPPLHPPFGWSSSALTVRARVAARFRDAEAPQLLAAAVEDAASRAEVSWLDADLTLMRLARAAREIALDGLGAHAETESNRFGALRRAGQYTSTPIARPPM